MSSPALAGYVIAVPRFEPFRALRYTAHHDLSRFIAPPYDVLSDDDVRHYLAKDEHNIVAIDVPLEHDGPGRYLKAAELLRCWQRDGVLVGDEADSFTLYRMNFTDESGQQRETVGVLGALEVVDEGAGGVLPHERTTPKAKSDRLDLTRATETNLSPVWGLSLAAGLTALLSERGEPLGQYTDEQGVLHSVERVSDPQRCAEISGLVAAHAVVIADGHHRYAISRTYRDEQRNDPAGVGDTAEMTLTYVGELIEEQLSVAAIHRLVSGLSFGELRSVLSRSFELVEAGVVDAGFARSVIERQALCLVGTSGEGTYLVPKHGAFAGVRDLDSARLEHALGDSGAELSYQHGVDNVLQALRSNVAPAGVLIRPVSIAEIRRTADEGLLMPPKSTFFTPKLRTGLVLRPLR